MPKLSKKPVTAADMARLRAKSQTPERRKEVASNAARSAWESLSDDERAAKIAKMVAARGAKRRKATR